MREIVVIASSTRGFSALSGTTPSGNHTVTQTGASLIRVEMAHWSIPSSLNNEAISHIMEGDQDHPSVGQANAISDCMFQVIMAVLIADGFDVRPSDDGMNAGFIDILSVSTKH